MGYANPTLSGIKTDRLSFNANPASNNSALMKKGNLLPFILAQLRRERQETLGTRLKFPRAYVGRCKNRLQKCQTLEI